MTSVRVVYLRHTKKHKSLNSTFVPFVLFAAKNFYILIVPQAIRPPEFPDGSVFMSSAFS